MGSLDPDVDMKQEFDDSGYVQDENASTAPMEEYRGSPNLLDLSDDVLLFILKNLSAHDLKSLGFTCARLGGLILDHTLWVDVDGSDVPYGRLRVRWMMMRVLGPHTRSLRLRGFATQSEGCLGYVTRFGTENNDDDDAVDAFEEDDSFLAAGASLFSHAQAAGGDNGFPFWLNALVGAPPPPAPPIVPPAQEADIPAPAQLIPEPSASTSGTAQPIPLDEAPSTSAIDPSEPLPSQQIGSQPSRGDSQVLAAGSQSWEVTPQLATPMVTEAIPSTSAQHASISAMASQSQATQPEPSISAESQPSTSSQAPVIASGDEVLPSQLPEEAPLDEQGSSQAGPSQASKPSTRFSTSSPTCPGPQLTFTHTGLRALSTICPNLTTLELDYCIIDCKTINLGHFPKTLLRLTLRGSKCFNMEPKTFLFKIHDYLPKLEDIDVSYCTWIEPACMLPLSKMAKLLRLSMRECPKLAEFVAYASLATRYGFKKLKVLDLRGTPVGDSEVAALGWLPSLEELYLSPSPKKRSIVEHAHYKTDPSPEFKELTDWEESDPEYFRTSEAQEEVWIQDEESARAFSRRFYNGDDPASVLLESMIAEPVSPSEYAAAYERMLAANNSNAPSYVTTPEQYRETYRNLLANPHLPRPVSGLSLLVRDTGRLVRRRRSSDQMPGRDAPQDLDSRPRNSTHRPASNRLGHGRDATQQLRPTRSNEPPASNLFGQGGAMQQLFRPSSSNQPPGPSGEGDKPGTSGQKRKSDKNNDSSDDDDHSQSKVPATTRTVATQTGVRRAAAKNNGKGAKPAKKNKTVCTPRRVFEITINDTVSRARLLRAANDLEAAANNDNNNRQDNNAEPRNDNQNPRNDNPVAGPSNRLPNHLRGSRYARGMRRLLMISHRAAQNRANALEARIQAEYARAEAEARMPKRKNAAEKANEAGKATDAAERGNKKPMDVDVNPVNDGPDPQNEDLDELSNEEKIRRLCTCNRRNRDIVVYRRRMARNGQNRSEAGNQAESANVNGNGDNNQATENDTEKVTNKAEKATDEVKEAKDEAKKATDETKKGDAEQGNKKPMDVDVNPVNEGPKPKNADAAGPSNENQRNNLCVYTRRTRNIVLVRRRITRTVQNVPVAGIQAGSGHDNGNGERNQATNNKTDKATTDAEKAMDETEKPTVDAEKSTDEAGKATDEAGKATDEAERASNEAEKAKNEAEEGNCKTKDAGNQTKNRILYENRAQIAEQPFHFAMDQSRRFNNAARVVIDAVSQADRQRPARPDRQRYYQFRMYRRPVVVEEFIDNVYEPRDQRAIPRGVLFAGLLPGRLDHSSLVSDASIRRFGRAMGENVLYLGGAPLPGRGNARPDRSNLRILSVTGFRHVTDSSLTHLASAAPQLQRLDLTGTGVTARAAQAFRALRPDVVLTTSHPEDNLELD